MAPCRSHHGDNTRQEKDHQSDPMGIESLKQKTQQEVKIIYIYI